MPAGFTGSPTVATRITGLRTGEIISHTPAGSDPHFWFGYLKNLRGQFTCSSDNYTWQIYQHGGFAPANLPPTAMRWLDNFFAQYDAIAKPLNQPGVYPQAFLEQNAGVVIGAKYVEAVQK